MLPSFRLVAAAFLCGFVMVFAGLHLVATLHAMHTALPMAAAQAAPLPTGGVRPARSVPAVTPVLFDLRFVANTIAMAPTPVAVTPPTGDNSAAAGPALAPDDFTGKPMPAPAAGEATADPVPVATADPQAAVITAPAETQAPVNSPRQPTHPDTPAVAAVEPLPAPSAGATTEPPTAAPPGAAPSPDIPAE